MDPRTEALSLKEFPLPDEMEVSPTNIIILDNAIANLESEISKLSARRDDLYSDRARLLDRAVKVGAIEDKQYKIMEVIKYGNRVCDPKKLKESNPTIWKAYEQAYTEKVKQDAEDLLQKAKKNIEEKVLLGLADKIFGKKNVDLCSQTTSTIEYEVRKK